MAYKSRLKKFRVFYFSQYGLAFAWTKAENKREARKNFRAMYKKERIQSVDEFEG